MSLAIFLQEELKRSGLNKAQFAQKMGGMHPTELARLLAGTTNKIPSRNVLEKLSRGLDLSVEELIAICTETTRLPQPMDAGGPILREGFYPELEARSHQLRSQCNPEQPVLDPACIADRLRKITQVNVAPYMDHCGNAEQWAQIIKTYPKSTRIFYFEQQREEGTALEIVGGWSVVFLSEECRNALRTDGQFRDQELALKDLASMTMPGRYCAYLANMSLLDRYNSYEYTPALVDSFLRQMEDYAKYGICVDTLYVNVYDRDRGFYKALGFREASEVSEAGAQLFVMESFPQDFVFAKAAPLLQRIQKLYQEV